MFFIVVTFGECYNQDIGNFQLTFIGEVNLMDKKWLDWAVELQSLAQAGLTYGKDVTADKIIAVQDRAKHNLPVYAYGVCKIFVLCSVTGGQFERNIETTEFRYFSEDSLPELAAEKNNEEQIKMCFNAYHDKNWTTVFD